MILLSIPIWKIISLVITFLLIYKFVFKFYSRVKLYPRGPKPLPIFGNCLMFTTQLNLHAIYLFQNLAKKHGDIFTFWLGSNPIVIISGINEAKEAFNKYEICDRCDPSLQSHINNMFIGGNMALSVRNVNDEFKFLRSLSAQTVRKFISTNKFPEIIHTIVKETVEIIKHKENDKHFIPFVYIESIFIRLLIVSTFGQKIAINDQLIETISKYLDSVQKTLSRIFISNFFPLFQYIIDTSKDELFNRSVTNRFEFWYKDIAKQKHFSGNSNNLAELINSIANKMLRINDESDTNDYISESNMIGTLISMFFGGSDRTSNTFTWILLLMCYYPEMQQIMRDEINDNIGNNNMPNISDKEKCVFVNAFICETLRYRNVTPFSVSHIASRDTNIGDLLIPKGSTVIILQLAILNDSRYWKNPEIFNPQRFINSERKLIANELSAFIPFSTGKRMCIGDKFAMNMLFLVLSTLLQATNGMKFVLSEKLGTDLEPLNRGLFLEPKPFKVLLK